LFQRVKARAVFTTPNQRTEINDFKEITGRGSVIAAIISKKNVPTVILTPVITKGDLLLSLLIALPIIDEKAFTNRTPTPINNPIMDVISSCNGKKYKSTPTSTNRNIMNSNREGASLRKNKDKIITTKELRFKRKVTVIALSSDKAKNCPP
jgi:hypothetical protein